jgi:uncharacterized membrane protein YhaH (DUF805 family)
MDWNYLFLSFDGRISRQPFWIGFAVLFAAEFVVQSFVHRMDGERLAAIVDLAFTYPEFALLAKRAHDRNTPIWLLGVFFAGNALINFQVIMGWSGTQELRPPLFIAMLTLWMVFALALLIELGLRPGVAGRNQFGPNPLDGRQ